MKQLRQCVRKLILEACNKNRYWGTAGAGVVMLCTDDNTIFLQQRSNQVSSGRGQWAFPGGGYHPLPGKEFFVPTPIPDNARVNPNSPVLEKLAFLELEEEAGYDGSYYRLEELVTYEDCGFIYKTFIIDIDLQEKQNWVPTPQQEHSWEVMDHGWFDGESWMEQDLYFGFTPVLINAIKKHIG